MRKYFLFAATAAVVLSSCSNDEEVSEQPAPETGKTITVSAYVPGRTRSASEAGYTDLTDYGFYLFAYDAKDVNDPVIEGAHYVFSTGTSVSGSSDELTTVGSWAEEEGTTYTWPSYSLMFTGIYIPDPETGDIQGVETGDGQLYLSVDGSQDVLLASAVAASSDNDGTVNLTFNHILAKIAFEVACTDTLNYRCSVSNLTLNAPHFATYNLVEGSLSVDDEPVSFDCFNATNASFDSKLVFASDSISFAITYDIYDAEGSINTSGTKEGYISGIQAGYVNTVKFNLSPASSSNINVSVARVSDWSATSSEVDIKGDE